MKRTLATVEELAVRYAVHPKTIYKWTYQRRLPVVRFNSRCIRFDVDKCDRALKWNPSSVAQTLPDEAGPGRTLITSKELAHRYAAHLKTIYEWTKVGILPVVKINSKCVRYDVAKCDLALERRTRNAK